MNLSRNSKSKISHIIFTSERFPIDSPGGRRVSHLIDKGLLNNLSSVLITLDIYKRSDIYKFPLTFNYKFLFVRGSFIIKFLLVLFSIVKFLFDLIYLFTFYKIKKVYIYSRFGIFTFIISLIGKLYNSEIIIDCTEWYSYNQINGFINKLQEYIHRNFSMKLSDKFYTISKNISKLIQNKYPSKKVFLIYPHSPIFIINLINSIVKKTINEDKKIKTLIYAGSFKESDDPLLLLNNLIRLSKLIDFKLFIISKTLVEKKISKKLYGKINILKNNLKNRFDIYGYLSNENYFKVIHLSDIILLPRSNYGYSKYNQPMRLYEYSLFNKKIITANIDEEYQKISNNICLYDSEKKYSFFEIIYKALDQ